MRNEGRWFYAWRVIVGGFITLALWWMTVRALWEIAFTSGWMVVAFLMGAVAAGSFGVWFLCEVSDELRKGQARD